MATLFEIAARIQAAGGAESLLLLLAKATLILAIARLLLAALPRASAATRHLIATAALVGVAAMPVLTFLVPAWKVAGVIPSGVVRAASTPQPQGTQPARTTPSPSPNPAKTIGVADTERPTIGNAIDLARVTGVVPDEPLSAMQRGMNVIRATWKGLLVTAIALVMLLMLAQMLLGMGGVWYVARRAKEVTHDEALLELDRARDQLALKRDVRLLCSSRISVPVLWGFFRPVLLLPADVASWPAERLRVVLLHELAHLKRSDGISLILTRIAACVFWYHPLAWSLERAGRNDCERACDDLVLASGTKPSDYADHLLAIARSMPTFDPFRSVTLAMTRKSQLEGRLLSILQPHVVRRAFSGRGVAIACAAVLAFVIPFSALRLIADPAKAQTKDSTAKRETTTKSDTTVTVTPDVEAIEDFLLAKLGKYDKRIDKLAREPRNGEEWWERAYNLYNNERYAEAAEAFRKAAEQGHRPATALYNEACSYALLGQADRAIASLKDAIDAGWDDTEKIAEDSDFDPIRSDPRFARAMQQNGGEIATRRVTETMERYNDLRSNKDDHNWFEVGADLLRLRRLDESIDAFQHSIVEQEKESSSMYNIACAYSLKNDAANGMEWLGKAVDNGFGGDEKLRNDPDIAFLRTQSGFDELRRRAKDFELRGCCNDDNDDERAGWREVMEHHRAVARRYPNYGRPWFNLGYAAIQARDLDTALDAFNRALQLNHRVGTTSYNIACTYALRGENDAAFEWLYKARDAGFKLREYLRNDNDLDALHDDPRWKDLRR